MLARAGTLAASASRSDPRPDTYEHISPAASSAQAGGFPLS